MTRDDAFEITGDTGLLFADGFDDAIVGVGRRASQPDVVVYDYDKAVGILTDGGMPEAMAVEHLEFNSIGAWAGERTPIWLMQDVP